eukprot:TRINITY_DN9248_c0_g1_i1.p1 TRINITY_DN9248_c0_g1~~TRINITY_DN9248_c0_g1_i1.p1  ORF type:complete len:456 (-),score=52.96 TRINITY_DN9248_c0_g1_i1:271-1509(-)
MNAIFSGFFITDGIDEYLNYNQTSDGEPNVIQSLYTEPGKSVLDIERNYATTIPPALGTGWSSSARDAAAGNLPSGGDTAVPDADGADEPSTGRSGYLVLPSSIRGGTEDAYTDYLDVVLSSANKQSIQIYMYQPVLSDQRMWVTGKAGARTVLHTLIKPRAFVSKLPGFYFSWIPPLALANQPALLSMNQFKHVLERGRYARLNTSALFDLTITDKTLVEPIPDVPPIQKVLIKMKDDATDEQKQYVINGLKNFITDDLVQVIDTEVIVDTFAYSIYLVLFFFYIASGIAVVLCFFVLWVSFTANVRENAWELGVLRAVGLNRVQIILVYSYEAVAIFFSALLMATAMGFTIAVTLAAQGALFDQLPVQSYFPYYVFSSLFVASLAITLLGSYLPSHTITKKEVAHTIKGI